MQRTHLGPRADALAHSITDSLLEHPSVPTAIMAGHEVVAKDGTYSDVFGEFPEVSRNIGKAIIERTRDRLADIKLFALINDWSELRALPEEERNAVRLTYWRNPAMELDEVKDETWMVPHLLPGRGAKRSIKPLGRFSEYALQQSFRSTYGDRRIGQLSEECNLCSSEIVMMTSMLYRRGIRRVVSFVPNVCTRAVSVGSALLEKGEFRNDELRFDEPFEMTNVYLNAVNTWSEEEVLAEQMPPIRHVLKAV